MAYRKSVNSWGRTKPPVGSQIDWSDPINRLLVGCWLTNENGGSRLVDIAMRHDAALSGFTWKVQGKLGTAVKYVIATPTFAATQFTPTGITDFSLSAWLAIDSTSALFPVSARNAAASNGVFMLYENGGTGIEVGFSNGGSLTRQRGPSNWTIGDIHHVVGTHVAGATSMKLYLDGVAVGSPIESAASNPGNGGKLAFGRDGDATTPNYFAGPISNVRFYARALSAKEARQLYLEPFAGIYAPRRRIISRPPAPPPAGAPVRRYYDMMIGGVSNV